jgi:hypothetical protein
MLLIDEGEPFSAEKENLSDSSFTAADEVYESPPAEEFNTLNEMYRTHQDDRLKRGATNSTFSAYENNYNSHNNSRIPSFSNKQSSL